MPKGFMGSYARRIEEIEEEVEMVEVHVQWLHLRCGHILRFTGKNVRKRPYGKVNCTVCESEARVAARNQASA